MTEGNHFSLNALAESLDYDADWEDHLKQTAKTPEEAEALVAEYRRTHHSVAEVMPDTSPYVLRDTAHAIRDRMAHDALNDPNAPTVHAGTTQEFAEHMGYGQVWDEVPKVK
ncbi:MAG TPA: hypothetical protein VLF40_02605 [Candidatus Saccharimonadales bacterium]|nr:hypothetical protein [Candidatus Saccharimonadales bacterium]